MNSFLRHHRHSVHFSYSCFDRIICNGMIPAFQHSSRAGTITWFLRTHRQAHELNHRYFAALSRQYHDWVLAHSQEAGITIDEPPSDCRREDWVEPYFQQMHGRPGVAVILKYREPERIAVHFARSNDIAVERRSVNLYYFYLNDRQAGRMFVRVCPYFPFHVTVWMNGHNWLARRLEQEGIAFDQRNNLFLDCANPERLQQLADAFGPQDLRAPVDFWLARLVPFFTDAERQQGYRHELFMTQMEYCHNLIFHKQAALERLFDRLMDANRTLGHPDKLAITFGRPCFQPDTRTGEIVLKMTKQRTPVIRCGFQSTSIKQYVRDGVGLRTESTSHRLQDLAIPKHINNLPKLRQVLARANERYLDVQQDVLASYVDRGQLQQLRQPTVTPSGRRLPGLHIDDPRFMALLQAITCFVYLVGKGCFRTRDLLIDVRKALGNPQYQLSQLRYDLSKLRGKGLVLRLPGAQTYQLTSDGYRLAMVYLKLYHRLYAPLTAAIRDPLPDDRHLLSHRQTKLDRLYVAVDKTLHALSQHIGIPA